MTGGAITGTKRENPGRNLPQGHPEVPEPRIGLLLINLGTPDGTDYRSMRRYLGEFLSDRRVIELSPWLWQPLLQGVILTTRPSRSGRNYAKIWNRERDESPLRTITRAQAEGLGARFADGEGVVVDWAMRYGSPSIGARLEAQAEQGCR
ncbi:MAG: ferrochelatase, partial [Tistlia sp.]